MEYVTLNNGIKMPILGYGVYQVTKEECERCVLDALEVGYRSIDTAQSYFNEEEVGNAIKKSGIKREDIFLTSKVWIEHYGYEQTKASVMESLRKLQTEYIDLMLLHQPFSDYYGAYRALEELYNEGVLRAIGVSNFYPDRLVDIANFADICPMVNQVETHIFNQQTEAKKWMDKYEIQIEAWAPFGEGRGGTFDNPVLMKIGEKYVKKRAAGKCQLCNMNAPFIDKNREPYLECHHIEWLSEGGKDAIDNCVALCPNCHRKMHLVNDKSDIAKLKAALCRNE